MSLLKGDKLKAPPVNARLRRVFWGPSILVALSRAVWRSPEVRARYLRVMLPQALLTVVVGVFIVIGVKHQSIHVGGGDLKAKAEHGFASALALAASLFGTLSLVEWIIIALAREHHDALSYDVAVLVGVPPEEQIEMPRVRLNIDWLVNKMKRRVQGGIILAVTLGPLALAAVLVMSPVAGAVFGFFHEKVWAERIVNSLPNVVATLGGLYWLGVFTIGKTAHAWRDAVVDDPFFLRFIDKAVARFPRGLGWLHLYVRLVRRAVGMVRRPASVVEHATWETAGLILCRVVISIPALYTMIRPLIPVAATVIIAARAPATLSGLPVALVLEERQ